MSRSLMRHCFRSTGWLVLFAFAMAGVIVIAGPLFAQDDTAKQDELKKELPAEPAAPQKETKSDSNRLAPRKPEATDAAPAKNSSGPLDAQAHIEAVMNDKTQLNFTDTPLIEAMQFLGSLHNYTVHIEKSKLEEAAVAMDAPLNYALSGVTLESALNVILEPLQLTYVIEDEMLKITTVDAAEERYVTRIYDVKGLEVAAIKPEKVVEAIEKTVNGAKWRTKESSEGGAIVVVADALVISQTQPKHREIQKLINQIERLALFRPNSVPLNKGVPLNKSQATVPSASH